MSKTFYLKMAAMNLRKNGRTYGPYFLTCLCTMAVFYIVSSIALNEGIRQLRGGDYVYGILSIGSWIVGFFCRDLSVLYQQFSDEAEETGTGAI